jgi:undecaprenyl diphosphate synthase
MHKESDPKKPHHIAIIMDGNGRWAKQRHLPRVAGHRAGLEVVRKIVKACGERGIKILSLFAFSSENWHRPEQEISYLMELFLNALEREAHRLHKNNIQLRVIGDASQFSDELRNRISIAEQLTANNTGLILVIAAGYGGRWDLTQAMKKLALQVEAGALKAAEVNAEHIASHLTCHDLPEPELLIRTSGEQRISNFFLWQLAYTELYFTDIFWPDFDSEALDAALAAFATRERRFGYTAEQVGEVEHG